MKNATKRELNKTVLDDVIARGKENRRLKIEIVFDDSLLAVLMKRQLVIVFYKESLFKLALHPSKTEWIRDLTFSNCFCLKIKC